MESDSTRMPVSNEADATRTVIEAGSWCKRLGLTALDSQAVSTAVSELSRNILKYAGRGEIVFSTLKKEGRRGLHVVASDRGPGIADIDSAMQDHFSSSGTLGLGLPGVRRLMDEFEIESSPGQGTRVSISKWAEGFEPLAGRPVPRRNTGVIRPTVVRLEAQERRDETAAVLRPCRGERVSGDLAMVLEREDYTVLAVIDALGHGAEASQVAQRAGQIVAASDTRETMDIIMALQDGLKGSVGAAAGIAIFEQGSASLRFCGVGNTVARVFGREEQRFVSSPGILGEQIRTPSEQRLALAADDLFVLYSDGIRERFGASDYPQMRYQGAQHVANTLLERFGKDHDDASCVVLRCRS